MDLVTQLQDQIASYEAEITAIRNGKRIFQIGRGDVTEETLRDIEHLKAQASQTLEQRKRL